MKLYFKLAIDGIRKNKRLYVPYILTCIGAVIMYLIIDSLRYSDVLLLSKGGDMICNVMEFGSYVMAVFSYIFMFYTNSFLLRRRKKEFGLLSVLGMGKRHLAFVVLFETLAVAIISLGGGIVLGTVFAKMGELWILKMTGNTALYGISVSLRAMLSTFTVFLPAFILLFANSVCRIWTLSITSLMKSENEGEKPPRANYLLGIIGIILIAGAYVLAVTVAEPEAALLWFFVAVVAVIIGTYLLFIAGSVMICKIMQNCKRYYYKSEHFVSVSSMTYRMKRNGAGLASVCILATMVLVMISTVTCLFVGGEYAINKNYPNDMSIALLMQDARIFGGNYSHTLENTVSEISEKYDAEISDMQKWRQISFEAQRLNEKIIPVDEYTQIENPTYIIRVIPTEDYNLLMNTNTVLKENEVIVHAFNAEPLEEKLDINGNIYTVAQSLGKFISDDETASYIMPTLTVVVNDAVSFAKKTGYKSTDYGDGLSVRWKCDFNIDADDETEKKIGNELRNVFFDAEENYFGTVGETFLCKAEYREEWQSLIGSLFFLALLLGVAFAVAMVLIIYYKQISEGYEDAARFDIMQKVGMTKREIRKSINSQLLTVFFIPLLLAVCHLCFAFSMLRKILLLFGLNNLTLILTVTAVTVCIFACFYAVTYKITSNAYYNIVSGSKKE